MTKTKTKTKTKDITVYEPGSVALFSSIDEFMKVIKKEIVTTLEITKKMNLIKKHVGYEKDLTFYGVELTPQTLEDKEELMRRAKAVDEAIKEIVNSIRIGSHGLTLKEIRSRANQIGTDTLDIEKFLTKDGLAMVKSAKKKAADYILEQKRLAKIAELREQKAADRKKKAAEAKAYEHEAKGNTVKADFYREVAATIVAPTVTPMGLKDTSSTSLDDITVTIYDPGEVLRQIVAGNLPVGAVEFKNGILKTTCKNEGWFGIKYGLKIEGKVNIRLK